MSDSEPVPFRRVVVWLTIGSFGVAALMGVVALLGAGAFGATEGRILFTTLAVGSTSVAMLCYLATSGTRFAAVGAVAGVVVLAPFLTSVLIIWTEDWNDELFRVLGVGITVAATLAQVSLLLALAGDRRNLSVVLWPTVGLVALVALIVCVLILGDDAGDGALRLLGIVAILDVLGTVTTLALALFGKRDAATAAEDVGGVVRLSSELDRRVSEEAAARGTSSDRLVADAVEQYLQES